MSEEGQGPEEANGVLNVLASAASNNMEDNSDASGRAAAQLEKRLQEEIDQRMEERFLFAVILVVLFDAHVLIDSENWSAPLIIGVLQLIALTLYARRCGIEEVDRLVDKAIHAFKRPPKE